MFVRLVILAVFLIVLPACGGDGQSGSIGVQVRPESGIPEPTPVRTSSGELCRIVEGNTAVMGDHDDFAEHARYHLSWYESLTPTPENKREVEAQIAYLRDCLGE